MATPFEPTGPEVPPAPIDIPTPNLPPANFGVIGQQVAQGVASGIDWSKVGNWILNILPSLIGQLLAILLGWIETVIAWFIQIIFKVWNNAEGGTDQIAAAALSGIFNEPVSAAAFQSVTNPSSRTAVVNDLVNVVTTALGAGFTGPNAQTLAPSYAGADKFMQTALRMSIEGWLQGWLFEAFSAGFIKHFGDLKDILERSLGIGRLARRVMGPPVKILVEDPFTWLLNQTYRPTQLGASTAIREFIRGNIDQPTLDNYLGYAGIPTSAVPAMINEARPHLGVGSLVDLVNAGYMDQPTAIQELMNAGYDTTTANWLWQAEQVTRQKVLAKTYVDAAEALYVGRKMDTLNFQSIVNGFTNQSSFTPGVGIPGAIGTQTFGVFTQAEAQMIIAAAALKRANASQFIPLGQALQMFEGGLIGLDDYRRMLTLHGYSNGEATVDQWSSDVDAAIDDVSFTPWLDLWEIWAVQKSVTAGAAAAAKAASAQAKQIAAQTKLAKAQAAAAMLNATEEAKGVSIAKYETLVKDGLKTIADYQLFLAGKGLSADNIAAFTTVLQNSLTQATTATTATGLVVAGSKAKGLSLAQLQAAVKNQLLSIADYETQLQALGYSADAANVLGQVLQDQINAAALKASTSAAAAAALDERHVSLAQEEKAVLLGLQTIDQYKAMLVTNGFAPEDVELLAGILSSQLATTQAAAAKKLANSGQPGTKHLNVAQVEKLVRAGQATTADYQNALVDAGYDATSVTDLVALLNLQLANDQHLAAASGRSGALLTSGGLSLSDIRTAVKLGVVDISVYDAALTAAGVSSSDAAVLHASLIAQLANSASTAGATKRVSQAVAATGTTLDALAAQVLAGTMTVPSFAAALSAAGVAAPDVAAFTALLNDQLANTAATQALEARVSTAAAAKGITLAQEAAAVKAGVQTIDQYQAFVASLGYDPSDVAILVATEADALGISPPAASSSTTAA